jgi:hypothetical protein
MLPAPAEATYGHGAGGGWARRGAEERCLLQVGRAAPSNSVTHCFLKQAMFTWKCSATAAFMEQLWRGLVYVLIDDMSYRSSCSTVELDIVSATDSHRAFRPPCRVDVPVYLFNYPCNEDTLGGHLHSKNCGKDEQTLYGYTRSTLYWTMPTMPTSSLCYTHNGRMPRTQSTPHTKTR